MSWWRMEHAISWWVNSRAHNKQKLKAQEQSPHRQVHRNVKPEMGIQSLSIKSGQIKLHDSIFSKKRRRAIILKPNEIKEIKKGSLAVANPSIETRKQCGSFWRTRTLIWTWCDVIATMKTMHYLAWCERTIIVALGIARWREKTKTRSLGTVNRQPGNRQEHS